MRPHKVHVDSGGEYNGETYIWCECLTPEGEIPVHCFGHPPGEPRLFEGLFEGEGLPELQQWLRHHQEEARCE
jgi:hypothetical protein